MKTWLKENWFIGCIVFVFTFTLLGQVVFAHPGNTDSLGCHTCRTNCASWGLSYGEYHCHNSKGLLQPEDPIRSHYGEGGTGWTEPWPDYSSGYSSPSYQPLPSCPLFSSYDSLSGSCKCNSGYIVKGSQCVSLDSACQDQLGYSSSYNSLYDKCECSYGYIIDSGICVSALNYCSNNFGFHSSYNSLNKSCECDSGYIFDSGKSSCVDKNEYCESKFGLNSEYDLLSKQCQCKDGYVAEASGDSCISGNSYCQINFGYYSTYDSYINKCECISGFQLIGGQCTKKQEKIIEEKLIKELPKVIIPEIKKEEVNKEKPKVQEANYELNNSIKNQKASALDSLSKTTSTEVKSQNTTSSIEKNNKRSDWRTWLSRIFKFFRK